MKFRSVISRLCALVFPFFGVAVSCNPGSRVCEYGVPNADFEIKGKVVDADNNSIKGIKVSAEDNFGTDGMSSTFTDESGRFDISFNNFPSETVVIEFSDVDGVENGEFISKTETVSVTKVEDSDESWYDGRYAAENVVVVMEKAQSSDENQ